MFKHSKVLNLSPQIRQGGDENKVSYKNFRKLASNLASTTRKARAREVVKVDCVVVLLLFSYFVFLANETCLVFGFHQLCHLGSGFALQRWSRSKNNKFVKKVKPRKYKFVKV